MKARLRSIVLLLFIAQMANAQNFKFGKVSKEELEEKVHPIEPDANAAVLYREYKTKFEYAETEGFYTVTEVLERIKIYKKEGFIWGTQVINLQESNGRSKEEFGSLKAYTYTLGVDDKIEDKKLSSDGVFDEKMTKYWKQKKFTMPNLKEGCVIEYKYTLKSPFISSVDKYVFQETIPVNQAYLKFASPEYLNYKTHQRGWLPINITTNNRPRTINYRYTQSAAVSGSGGADKSISAKMNFQENISEVTMRSVPAVTEEVYAGNIDNYTSSIKFELAFTKFPNSTYNAYSHSWEDVSERVYKSTSFGAEIKKTNYFKDDVDALLVGATSPSEKMTRIFEHAKSKMTWNSIHSIYTDEGVKNAYKKGSGSVGDINLALTSMLRYAGLNANPVLISTRNHGVPIFPTRDGFNYVVSGVVIDGAVYLCDATNKSGEINILEDKLLNWQGRMVLDEKTSAWVPLAPKKHAIQNTMLSIEIDKDLSVKGTSKNRVTGHYAMATRDRYENLNEDAQRKMLERNKGETELNTIAFENLGVLHKPVTYSYGFDASHTMEDIGGKLYFSPLIFLATSETPFKLDDREYPVDYGYKWKDRYLINITIPEGYVVESIPESTSFGMEQGIGSYKYSISKTGNKVQLSVELAMNEAVIPAGEYGGLKRFYELLIDKENEKVVLSKI